MTNIQAFLDMIAMSEGTYGIGDNGYNVLVGSTKKTPLLFTSYLDHPRIRKWLERYRLFSTAAGRYQILARTFDAYKTQLGLRDFSPAAQDAITIQLIKERGALPDINEGRIPEAIRKCRNIWASLPGAGYGQQEQRMEMLVEFFNYRVERA